MPRAEKKVTAYHCCYSKTFEDLEDQVEQYILNGWQPDKGQFQAYYKGGLVFVQVMVRKKLIK